MFPVFLVAGRRLYFLKKPQGNILIRVAKCISVRAKISYIVSQYHHITYRRQFEIFTRTLFFKMQTAISHKVKNWKVGKNQKNSTSEAEIISDQNHWLDTTVDKHGVELVADIKIVFRLLPLYVPLCFFWALYDQQVN